jgi:hypothetical protein
MDVIRPALQEDYLGAVGRSGFGVPKEEGSEKGEEAI